MSAFVALIVYGRANDYHRKSNRATVHNMLLNLDGEIYAGAINPETNYLLSALYFDKANDIDAKQKADMILKNVSGDSVGFTWASIPELYDSIMSLGRSYDSRDISKYNRLLNGIVHSERVLFLVYRAYIQFRQEMITQQDWDDFRMYIIDFSQSPLFLCAMYINNDGGYFNKDFAKELQQVYRTNENPLVDECFSIIKEDTWINENNRQ
jgi:hypothetical protein